MITEGTRVTHERSAYVGTVLRTRGERAEVIFDSGWQVWLDIAELKLRKYT